MNSFKIGDKVKITPPADADPADPALNPDEGPSYVGLTGEIVDSSPWGEDTLFSVKLSDGRQDGFFSDELTLV